MAAFFFIVTLFTGAGLINEGADKCIQDQGFTACVEQAWDGREATYEVND